MFSWLRSLFRGDQRVRVRRILQGNDIPTGVYFSGAGPLVELTCGKHSFASTAPLLKIFDPSAPERRLILPGVVPVHTQAHREIVLLFCVPELIQTGMVVEEVGNAWESFRDQMNEHGRWSVQKPLPFETVRAYET
jgi:hypothetical protein